MRPRKILVGALAALAVSFLVLVVSQTQIGQIFELKTLDYRFRQRASDPPIRDLLVVAVDDRSLEVAGRWPWPRDYHALLLQAMAEHKPKAVAFDMFFSEPEKDNPAGDAALVEQARKLGNVVFGAVAKRPGESSVALPADLVSNAIQHVIGPIDEVVGGNEAQLPLPELRHVAATGFINAERDADGVLRHLSLVVRVGGKLYPSLVLQTVCEALGVSAQQLHVFLGDRIEIPLQGGQLLAVPIDEHGRLFINFRHRPRAFEATRHAVNYLTVVQSYGATPEGKAAAWDLQQLSGRIVLIGASATGMDVAPTALDDNMPLVFAQANAVDNIFQQDFVRRVSPWLFWPLLTLVLFGLALFNLYNVSVLRSVIFSVLLIVVFALALLLAFGQWNLWIEFFWPVVGMFLVFASSAAYQSFTEGKEKRFVKRAFQQYVSPKVMAEVLDNPSKLVLGGVRRRMTVLFSDIRGFTAYSEKRPPEEVVPVLNELQDELSKVIFQHEGTLNKYMGDAIMAFWGAPGEPKPDDALRAVRAAHGLVETLKKLKEKWRVRGIEPFGIGVGVNTGEMIVGNMGSTVMFDYTVIGDEVNLGARLESLTRQFDANIILSEATYLAVREHVHARELGEVTVKGKAKPVRIYALEGLNSEKS
jgi:adenylate cyclase